MTPNMPLSDLLEALRRNAALPRELAEATPPQVYTSPEFLELERDQIFNKEWICVGRSDEFSNPGDYRVMMLSRDEVIVLRDRDGVLRALSNICRHRMMSLLEGDGNVSGKISCPYHAWTYDLQGQLLHAHGVDDRHAGFLRDCRLPEFPCERWHGFIFVCLDVHTSALSESDTVRAVNPMISQMHLEDMRLVYSSDQEWDVNWKCLVENFMEGYHLSTVHQKTLHPYTPTKLSRYFTGGDNHFGYYSYYPEDLPPRGRAHPDMSVEDTRRSLMLAIAPSSVFAITGFKATYNLIQPISPTRLRTRIGLISSPPSSDEDQHKIDAAVDLFQRTFAEDKAMLVRLMRGMTSRHYSPSVLAKADYEGTIWDFYRYLARNLSLSDQTVGSSE